MSGQYLCHSRFDDGCWVQYLLIVSNEELRELVASLVSAQNETDRLLKETAEQQKDTDRRMKETDRLIKENAEQQKETDRLIKETAKQQKDTDRRMKETDRQMKETDLQLKELGKQIGGLGNKFGDFAEGMAMPSLMEILAKRFGADQIVETKRLRKGADEVKSILTRRELDKFIRNLRRFYQFLPQFKGYRLYGVLAAVESSQEMDAAALAEGVCLARMHGDIFRLKVPRNFQPKDCSI